MYVVTGGAGFIGSVLVAELEAKGLGPILVSDRMDDMRAPNLAGRHCATAVEPPDLDAALARHRGEIRAVFHMGAISDTTVTDLEALRVNNIELSMRLWHWCADAGVPFIYASSAATYGGGENGFEDRGDEEFLARLAPLNPYGQSKNTVDREIAALVARGAPAPPRWAGLKFFNVYGPNEYHKGAMRSVVKQVHEQIRRGEPARLFRSANPAFPDGGQMRDFVWVGDAVDAMLWLMRDGPNGGLYNLGSGRARSFIDLARAVFTALGMEPQIEFVDMPEHLKARYQYFTEAPMARLRAAGWPRPATTLEDGVKQYVRNYLEAPNPYR